MIVKCNRRCWDSKRGKRYHIGMEDDIDPLEPIAMYFDFPPGTEVYWKKPGGKTGSSISTTRIVPGLVAEREKLQSLETEEEKLTKRLKEIKNEKGKLKEIVEEVELVTCPICGVYKGSKQQVVAHKIHCNPSKE